ncbi:hypothetical protein FRB94_006397 [Tulasnella sp. JGI-2019a]|nr:hypothetical protein FRB94_006397 [Tulasnella sp. JGI-2019a]
MSPTQLYPELYLAIFDRLDRAPGEKADLRNVSTTSHLFHELAEPLLFTEIILQMDYSDPGIETRTRTLMRHLTSRAETRQWVKSIEISVYGSSNMAVNHIADVFVELHNLRHITINDMNLTDSMVRHLPRLSHPFSLNCWDVGCVAKAEDLVSDTQNLQLTELIVDRLRESNMILLVTRLALGPRLSILHLGRRDSYRIYPIFSQNPGHDFDSLRDLEVYQPVGQAEMAGLVNLLSSCPWLLHLKIIPVSMFHTDIEVAFQLPPTSIPRLSSLEAPYDLARLLVRGRPLLSLKLRCKAKSNLDRGLLSQLAGGSTPLRGLDAANFIWRDDVLLDIVEYFPALQNLKLRVVEGYFNSMLERLPSDLKRLLPLQRFVIYSTSLTWRNDDVDIDHHTLKSMEAVNDRLALNGFRLKFERCWDGDESRWILLPLQQL